MKSSNVLLILAIVILSYWGGLFYYGADVGMTQPHWILGIMFGLLIPIITMRYVNDACEWDWS